MGKQILSQRFVNNRVMWSVRSLMGTVLSILSGAFKYQDREVLKGQGITKLTK